jgi:nucleotide-binding universal stress UspA family protein
VSGTIDVEGDVPMTMPGPILVALEMSERDRSLIDTATTYARALQTGICLIHVVPVAGEEFVGMPKEVEPEVPGDEAEVGYAYDRAREAERLRDEHESLRTCRAALVRQGLDVTALQLSGSPGDKIVGEARRLKAGLIVAGHRDRTVLGEIVFGSTSKDILAGAPCPVLLVPNAV